MARGPGERAGLTAELVARTALELADDGGLAALTVRGVARRLGVEPMSLYNHFANKDALLDTVWTQVLRHGVLPDDHPADTWQAYARDTAHRYRAALLEHPNVLPLMAERSARTAEALDLVQQTVRGLTSRGAPLTLAFDLVDVLSMFTIAHALIERRAPDAGAPPGLDPQRHRLLMEYAAVAAGRDPVEADAQRFDDAVNALVSGYSDRSAEEDTRS